MTESFLFASLDPAIMKLALEAKIRNIFGKQVKKLRKDGFLPAVLYGRGKDTLALEVPAKAFESLFHQAGESTIINLKVEGQGEKKVLIHEVAKHFMKDESVHVDFYEVDLTRKIHAKIPLHFIGTPLAVKELGGVLIKNLSEVEIEALPQDLPKFIEVNVESLKTFNDLIRLSALPASDKIKILGHPEDMVVSVQAPRTEEELAELEKPAAEAEKAAIETITKEQEVAKAVETGADAAKSQTPEAAAKTEKKEKVEKKE